MDILDHSLDTSGEGDEVLGIDSKAMLSQNLTIVEEGSLGSGGEEQSTVDHQTLLDTNTDSDVQYSFRSPDGSITYRVLQVEDGMETLPQIVSSSGFSNPGIQQVLTSQLNGQLYVIGNPGEVFNNQTQRNIAPRANILENTTTVTANIKKRDERRRATHNEVERRRRDKINNWIMKLSKIIPDLNSDIGKGSGSFEGQSKGGILAKACEYIMELRQSNAKLGEYLKENETLVADVEDLKQQNEELKRDNSILRTLLVQNGVVIPKELSHPGS